MANNDGKKFEQDFIKSLPEHIYCMRLKDAGGWSNAENTRFTVKNDCDFILHHEGTLFLLELKSHKGKSLPFSCISEYQLQQLEKAGAYKNVLPAYVINYRDLSETYIINAAALTRYIRSGERKSLNIDMARTIGHRVPQTLKKVRYRYDVEIALYNAITPF